MQIPDVLIHLGLHEFFKYELSISNGLISLIDERPMPEGRIRNTGSSLKPEYIIKDQQGNARISFEESTTAGVPVVRQENSYYGLGMNMTSTMALPTLPNKNLYNGGSEWQNDYSNAPDYYQTLNRNYDAALGRFIAADPMAEATASVSVYQYANNNPVMMNDPEGSYALPLSSVVYYQGQMTFGSGISRKDFKRAFAAMWGIWDNSTFFGEGDYAHGGIVEELMSVGGGAGSSSGGSGSSSGGGSSGSDGTPVTANGKTELYNAAEIFNLLHPNIVSLPEVNISAFRNNKLPSWWGEPGALGNPLIANMYSGNQLRSILRDAGNDVDPKTLGHNLFWTNYTGPWNPKSYNGGWNYKVAPSNRADIPAIKHDLTYDKIGITGAGGVFFDTRAIKADYTLVGSELKLNLDWTNGATPKERLEAGTVAIGIGIAAFPKTVVFGVSQAAKAMPASEFPGL